MAVGIDRLAGYREAIADAGLPVDRHLEAQGEFTQEGGAAAMARLLAVRPDIDGVFAASDLMAAGALSVLAEAGRSVPTDVSVVGFDNSLVATSTNPQLTSVHQPIEEMGQEAARLLVEAVDGRSRTMRTITLSTVVVERASSAGRSSP
jgi:DNA-binding LacI/PurR family transcriptional regulator